MIKLHDLRVAVCVCSEGSALFHVNALRTFIEIVTASGHVTWVIH